MRNAIAHIGFSVRGGGAAIVANCKWGPTPFPVDDMRTAVGVLALDRRTNTHA